MFSNKRIVLFIIATVAAIFLLQCSKSKPQTVAAKRGEIIEAVYATGVVEPVNWVKIIPEVAGMVVDVPAQEGQSVKKGDPLLIMDDREQTAARDAAIARAEYLDKEVSRQNALLKKKFTSEQSVDRTNSTRNETMAEIQRAEALIDKKRITAPIDGTVLKRDVEIGERLQPMMPFQDTKEIFWIGQLKPLRITAEVDEEDITMIAPGKLALIKSDAFPNKTIQGTLDSITPKGDPVNKNFRVRISLPDDSPLMIGMTVEVNIITRQSRDALMVPRTSIKDGKVWLKSWSGTSEKPVTTGIESETMAEIISGIEEGDEIFINPPVAK